MNQNQIGVIIGSLRKESYNRKLAHAIEKLAPDTFAFKHLEIGNLPLYNQDHDANQAEAVVQLKNEIKKMNGLLFITPEYNRSIPGVLKNALDNASRPYGTSAWAQKPAGIIGISPGAAGSALAQQHLRNILAYLDVPTLTQPEVFLQFKEGFFDASGNIANPDTKKFLQSWMERYVAWISKFQQ